MSTGSGRRRATGGLGLAAIACAAALGFAGQAQAATTAYPAGGSGFDGGAEGWTGSDQACSVELLGLPLPLLNTCTSTTVHDAGAGDPPGSITARTSIVLNLLSLFNGSSTWSSPTFTVPAGRVTGATLSLDRALEDGGLVNIGLTSDYTLRLHDLTAGTSRDVVAESLTPADSAFATRGAGVSVTPGHQYRISIATETSSTIGLMLPNDEQAIDTRFDNVALTVETADGPGGGDGGGSGGDGGDGGGGDVPGGDVPIVSDGVTIRRGPLNITEITNLMSRYSENADVGKGPGGSLVAEADCTVVGTPGNDRIVGTTGNDVICGRGGNDVIVGGGGRDLIDGGDGGDRINGGPGADLLLGLRGNDRLSGDAGNDRIGGGAGNDRLAGVGGADRLSGRSGNDRLAGGAGNDRLAGGAGRDTLLGHAGHDRLAGGAGGDRLKGGKGRDRLLGGPGNDRIGARDRARDVVRGGPGNDRARVDGLDRVAGIEAAR